MVECGYCQLGRKDLCKETTINSDGKEVPCETQIKLKEVSNTH